MSLPVSIRLAEASDAEAVTALLIELGCDVERRDVTPRLERLADRPWDRVYVAEAAGRVVGLLGLHLAPLLHRDCFGRITAFVVTGAHRGKGIGSRLLDAAEKWALSQGCTQIELNSGDHHAQGHAFYRAHGFRCDDRRFVKEWGNGCSNVHLGTSPEQAEFPEHP